jgi:hypothetical protein
VTNLPPGPAGPPAAAGRTAPRGVRRARRTTSRSSRAPTTPSPPACRRSSSTATATPGRDVVRCPEKAQPTTRKLRAKDRPLSNDFVSDEEFDRLLRAWFGNIARVLLPGRAFYLWGYSNVANYPPALKAAGLYFSQTIIWDKQHPVLTRKDYMGAHEWAYYGWKEGAAHVFYRPNNATDLWAIKKVNPQSMVHLTEKPVELAQRAIEYSSRRGENVLDLFGGLPALRRTEHRHPDVGGRRAARLPPEGTGRLRRPGPQAAQTTEVRRCDCGRGYRSWSRAR